jgi:hypothetical protein
MGMGKLVVTLDEKDLVELQVILMDRDEAAALEFLETRMAPKIPRKGTALCDSTRIDPYLLRPDPRKTPPKTTDPQV